MTQQVEAKTSTSVSSSEQPSYYGDSVTFTATISNSSGNGGTPTGSVQFYIDNTAFGSAVNVDGSGHAVSNATTTLNVGAHTIKAVYTNTDDNFQSGNGTTTQNVEAKTSTTVNSSLNPSVYNQSVTFTASISNSSGNGGTPTGTVQFYIDNTAFGSAVNVASSGHAVSNAISTLSVGGHTIKAVYTNTDGNFQSGNGTTTQNVDAATGTSVNSSQNPSTSGQSVTFTATVTNTSGNGGTPNGSVQFYIDNVAFSSPVNVSSGSAVSNATNSLQVGGHKITAVYTPSSGSYFLSSDNTASPLTQQVNAAGPSDVSSQVSITRGGFRLVAGQKYNYAQTITLTNTGSTTINGPIYVELHGLPKGVSLYNASGTSSATGTSGDPYILVTSGSLAPGASISITLEFVDPSLASISYTTKVFAGGVPL